MEGWLWEAVAFVVRLVGHGLDIDDEEVLRGHSVRPVIFDTSPVIQGGHGVVQPFLILQLDGDSG